MYTFGFCVVLLIGSVKLDCLGRYELKPQEKPRMVVVSSEYAGVLTYFPGPLDVTVVSRNLWTCINPVWGSDNVINRDCMHLTYEESINAVRKWHCPVGESVCNGFTRHSQSLEKCYQGHRWLIPRSKNGTNQGFQCRGRCAVSSLRETCTLDWDCQMAKKTLPITQRGLKFWTTTPDGEEREVKDVMQIWETEPCLTVITEPKRTKQDSVQLGCYKSDDEEDFFCVVATGPRTGDIFKGNSTYVESRSGYIRILQTRPRRGADDSASINDVKGVIDWVKVKESRFSINILELLRAIVDLEETQVKLINSLATKDPTLIGRLSKEFKDKETHFVSDTQFTVCDSTKEDWELRKPCTPDGKTFQSGKWSKWNGLSPCYVESPSFRKVSLYEKVDLGLVRTTDPEVRGAYSSWDISKWSRTVEKKQEKAIQRVAEVETSVWDAITGKPFSNLEWPFFALLSGPLTLFGSAIVGLVVLKCMC